MNSVAKLRSFFLIKNNRFLTVLCPFEIEMPMIFIDPLRHFRSINGESKTLAAI